MKDIELDLYIVNSLKHAQITSVDVALSFSIFKHVLDDRQHSFTIENLEKLLTVSFSNIM